MTENKQQMAAKRLQVRMGVSGANKTPAGSSLPEAACITVPGSTNPGSTNPGSTNPGSTVSGSTTAGNGAPRTAAAVSAAVLEALAPWLPAIRACDLFAHHTDEMIFALLPCFQPRIRHYRKGETIAMAGEDQEVFGIVLAGEVLVLKEDYAGNRLIIGIFNTSEIFGEVSVYAGATRWPNSVQANTACTVIFLPYDRISKPCCNVCQSHQILIANMLGIVARKALNMNSRIGYLKLRGMREKLAAYLYEQYVQSGSRTFMLPMNREQLADYLNVSRPSMSRELGRLRDEGVIDFFRSSFTIKDVASLRRMN